jgi:hypothetical protein
MAMEEEGLREKKRDGLVRGGEIIEIIKCCESIVDYYVLFKSNP